MRRTFNLVPVVLVCAGILTGAGLAQQKLAQTGMKFLNVGTDPRAVALAEAVTAVEGNSTSLFFNPACMARIDGFASAAAGQVQWIADIKHNFASVSISPEGGAYGVLGLMVQTVDYGELQKTIRSGNAQGYEDLGVFSPKAIMVGVGYARSLSDKFALGGNVKWVQQDLGDAIIGYDDYNLAISSENEASVFAFDFGLTYRTGFKSLEFGMVVRNFAKEVRYVNEGFQLPLTFKIGVSMDLFDLTSIDKKMHRFLLTVDAEHPRDYPERVRMGAEYVFLDLLALRAGFISVADEQKFSYGVGLYKALGSIGLGVDYAFTPFGVFGDVHRLSFQFAWI